MRSFRIGRGMASRVSTAASVVLLALLPVAFAPSANASESGAPAVSTGSAHAIGSQVDLEGTINPRGEAATYYFEYGPTVAYGSQTTTANLSAPTGTVTEVNVSQLVAGIVPGYHYRLVAINSQGPGYGHDRTYVVKKTTSIITKPKKTTKLPTLTFTFVKPPAEGQVVGSSLTIQGTLSGTGALGRQLTLQSSPYPSISTVFTNVGVPQTVTSTGRFSFVVPHLLRSTRYRVAAVGPTPIYSPVITALATVRVTLHARTAPQAGLVRLYGTVSPAVTGAIVFFQLEQAAKTHPDKPLKTPKNAKAEEKAEEKAEQAETPKFATAFSVPIKRATKTVSRFSIVETVRKTGLYRAYVQVPKGPLASGHSGNVLLHAAPKKSGKTKR
jgi:hypothetical protein